MNDAPKLTECPKCRGRVTSPGRFCVRCGEDFGRQYAVKSKPAKKTYWTLKCRSCSKALDPEDVFDREIRFYSGYDDDRGKPRDPPPPDPWAGMNVMSGGIPGEKLADLFNNDPDIRKQMQDDPLWARREIAKSIALDMPLGPHESLIRTRVLPCAACGEADPLGIV